MQKEIETSFLNVNKEELIKKLISVGAVDKGEEKLEEVIFYDKGMTWKGKGRFVRLRKTKGKVKLTYKNDQEHTVDSAREIELEVSDIHQCSEFLVNVGLKIIRKLEKYRHTFQFNDVTIDIDTWPKIPVYMEIEGPSIESLKDICNRLEFDWEKRFDGDAREVYKLHGYNMDDISVLTFNEFK